MDFSQEQIQALERVRSWYNKRDKQIFRLFGYAGTGKTTLAKYFAEEVSSVQFAAFTGKASQILRQKGADNAKTIHSLIYYQKGAEESEDEQFGQKTLLPRFILNPKSKIGFVDLIVIDECSMVNAQLGEDLLSFKRPILVLGDPAQLPPPAGCGFFTQEEPDFLLKHVFRQAKDNPILAFASDIRQGKNWSYGDYGALQIIPKADLSAELILKADQVLVGRNKTRDSWNKRIRNLKGFSSSLPELGDKLVCLTNDHNKGLLNGSIWYVTQLGKSTSGKIMPLYLRSEDGEKDNLKIKILKKSFEQKPAFISPYEKSGCNDFDFGYALTVHKAQGSQWDNIVLFDESRYFGEEARSWLYTGVTRAARTLTLAR